MEEWSIVEEPDESTEVEREREERTMSAAAEIDMETDDMETDVAQSLMAIVEKSIEKNKRKLEDREKSLKEREESLRMTEESLKNREESLKKTEEALKKAREGVESEKKLMAGTNSPKDFILLNVGGKKIAVLREVLCQFEVSLLAAHFSGTDHLFSPLMTLDSM